MSDGDYYHILWLDEKEMDELMRSPLKDVAGFPKYAAVDKQNGSVRFWPKIDPTKYVLMAKQGVV